MFVRGRERVAEVWNRFRLPQEGFVVAEDRGLFEARIVANADWAIDLFLVLADRLGDTVRVAVEDYRNARRWSGAEVKTARARDAILHVRPLLIRYAGVECSLSDDEDQVTLTPHLEVFVYGRSDRWFYFLRDLGLRRYRTLASRSWRLRREEFPEAPALAAALDDVATELGLVDG
jgi:hypothetical protein